MKKIVFFIIIASNLIACGGSGGNSNDSKNYTGTYTFNGALQSDNCNFNPASTDVFVYLVNDSNGIITATNLVNGAMVTGNITDNGWFLLDSSIIGQCQGATSIYYYENGTGGIETGIACANLPQCTYTYSATVDRS
jgi:glucan-binding YG repeat protein